jgi:hypothetical protein
MIDRAAPAGYDDATAEVCGTSRAQAAGCEKRMAILAKLMLSLASVDIFTIVLPQ